MKQSQRLPINNYTSDNDSLYKKNSTLYKEKLKIGKQQDLMKYPQKTGESNDILLRQC